MTATPDSAPLTIPALLAGFPKVQPSDWRTLVEAELKGAPFDRRMRWVTEEGIELRALYRREDLESVAHAGSWPGFAPYVRGATASGHVGHPWEVSQEIAVSSPAAFNDAARTGLQRGLTALNMVVDRATRNGLDPDWARAEDVGAGGLSIATLEDLARALDGVELESVPLFVRSGASGMPFAALLAALARRRGRDLRRLRGCIEVDPLGVLAHEGRLPQSLEGAYREMAALTRWAAEEAPGLQTICVHGRSWHESGGTAVHELALTLATAADYLRALHARGVDVEVSAPRLRFAHTVGTRFFVEIAKLRAARMLWARLVGACGGSPLAQRASLHVRTSLFNKTVYDPHVNLLRATVEAFAGVLGGCDSLQVGAFDEVVRSPEEFSLRVARNQQLVLREECHLTSVVDPAGGSWFVETLTGELASKAWAMFQEIERQGGMAAALRAGGPQREVALAAEQRLIQVARRRTSLIGTNTYALPGEAPLPGHTAPPGTSNFHQRRVQQVSAARTASEDARNHAVLERLSEVVGAQGARLMESAIAAVDAGATLGELTRAIRILDRPDPDLVPVRTTRAASGFERLRGAVGKAPGGRPRVFLANLGPLRQHKARADFARGFFEVGGFEVVSPAGFSTPAEAAEAARASGAKVVCICSTDDSYPSWVPPLVTALKKGGGTPPVVVLAGYPAEQVDAHRASGVDEFIHLGGDALEILNAMAARLGLAV